MSFRVPFRGKHKRTQCAPAADRQHTHRRRLAAQTQTAENGRQKNETPRAKHTTTAPFQQRVAQRQTTTALDNSPPRSGIKENEVGLHTAFMWLAMSEPLTDAEKLNAFDDGTRICVKYFNRLDRTVAKRSR
jgi:hypothetical protein